MNKREYVERLARGLAGVKGAEEIITEIEGHFADGAAKGRSEEEIAEALGEPEAMAREYQGSGKFAASEGVRQDDGSALGGKAARRRKTILIAAGASLAVALAVVGITVGVRQDAERQAEEEGLVSIRTPGFHLSVGNEGRVRMKAGGTTILDVDGHQAEGLSGLEAIEGLEDVDFSPATWGGSDLGLSGLDSLLFLDGIARIGDIYSFDPGTVAGPGGEAVDLRKELSLAGIDRIYLGADAADIVVKPGQDGRARARLLGVADRGLAKDITLDATTRGGELRFEARLPRMHGQDSHTRLVLLVELPAGYKAGLSVSTAAGDLALVNLAPSVLHAESSAGDLAIQGLAFGEARLESTAGDIMVKASKGRKLELQSGAGDLLLELDGQGCSWKASSGAGDVMAPGSPGEGPSSGSTGDGSLKAELRTGAGDILIRP